ncbi:MAG: MDR family MFS transporter [Cyclobacteriaceae bacterium]
MKLSKEKAFTLLGIILAMFLGALDQTIVATALPQIVEDLNGLNRYSMVATAYLVASTTFVPIYGKLADTYDRKKIELWAIAIFLAGSFLCGIAGEFGDLPILGDGMNQLIFFRAIQGLGGAGLFAMTFVIIADLFPPAERGKYQGLTGAAFGIASILGPYLGGLLTDNGSNIIQGVEGWRWVFYVNIPFAIMALFFIIKKMPTLKTNDGTSRIDVLAAIYLVTGLGPLVLAIELDKSGLKSNAYMSWIFFAIAFTSLILFYLRTRKSENPIINLSLFKNVIYRNSNIALLFFGAAFLSLIIFIPFFLMNVQELSATKAGITLIPLSLGVVSGSIISGQLVSHYGHYKLWMVSGAILFIIGVFFLTQMTVDTKYLHIIIYMIMVGFGAGPSMPLYTLAIQNAVSVKEIGQATSASQFSRSIGGTLGTAFMGSILALTLLSGIDDSMPQKLKSSGFELPGVSGESLRSFDKQLVHQKINQLYRHKLNEVKRCVKNQDIKEWQRLQNDPLLASAINGFKAPEINNRNLRKIEASLKRENALLNQSFERNLTSAFNLATSRIFYATIILLIVGTIVTFMIPEVPLRKSNEESTIGEDISVMH